MTDHKRTNSTLRAMLARRDKKIAALTAENAEARAKLADAIRTVKQTLRENAVLRNNIEVLQRPHRTATRDAKAREALRVLSLAKSAVSRSIDLLDQYERTTRRKL